MTNQSSNPRGSATRSASATSSASTPSSPLADLQHALARTHRARLARRRAIAAGAITLPALALVFTLIPSTSPLLPPSPRPRGEGGSPQANRVGGESATPALASETTSSSGTLSPPRERVAESAQPGEGVFSPAIPAPTIVVVRDTAPPTPMSDAELLAALAEAGHPSGLITINGRTTIVANTSAPNASLDSSPFTTLP